MLAWTAVGVLLFASSPTPADLASIPTALAQERATVPIVAQAFPLGGGGGLFLFDPSTGERLKRLVRGDVRQPMWAPDHKKIVYARGYLNELELWIVSGDGSGNRRITRNRRIDEWPSWAPDSRRLVVVREDDEFRTDSELVIVRADGSGERRLTNNDHEEECPSWSPDGRRVAFGREIPDFDIYTIRADGTGERQLTSGPNTDGGPLWSPDGRWLLFDRVSAATDRSDLFLIRRDGTRLRRLTRTKVNEYAYGWSPDGKRVVSVALSGKFDFVLRVTGVRGGGSMRLARLGHNNAGASPSWSADGSKVVFDKLSSDRSRALWIARADGSSMRELTPNPADEATPDWFSPPQECGAGGY